MKSETEHQILIDTDGLVWHYAKTDWMRFGRCHHCNQCGCVDFTVALDDIQPLWLHKSFCGGLSECYYLDFKPTEEMIVLCPDCFHYNVRLAMKSYLNLNSYRL